MRAVRMSIRFLTTLAAGACVVAPCFAQSGGLADQITLGPDLLNSMGVGSRSIALGGAFSAIADDASATFWNPGRLGLQTKRLVMGEYTNVLRRSYKSDTTSPNNVLSAGSSSVGALQPGFLSFVYPVRLKVKVKGSFGGQTTTASEVRQFGALGVSYTLGGYFDYDSRKRFNETKTIFGNPVDVKTTEHLEQNLRNTYVTVAYGYQWQPVRSGRDSLGVGVGYYHLNHNQTRVYNNSYELDGQTTSLPTSRSDDAGRGKGVIVGISYVTGQWQKTQSADASGKVKAEDVSDRHLSFGASYRSGTNVSGLSESARNFLSETPTRITAGVAYDVRLDSGKKSDGAAEAVTYHPYVLVSAEVQHYGSANSVEQTDFRKAVTNFHVGAEYLPAKPLFNVLHEDPQFVQTPLRFGFRTNASAATYYTEADQMVSLGFAYRRLNANGDFALSLEPSAEYILKAKKLQWTITGQLTF